MKLKSIQISGFKSFADRTTIFYHDGITGIIGPNGSGKSNIIDAVRWVMGEQTSKNLRADDASDIIFSGSQNRKPISLAEVTLVFTNDGIQCPAEFMHLPEVSIGRRINRGGEREYFMNREPCRLKDIIDFLSAIGLGSKSYAIIQQDKRDRIIQASPDDLREILEETAGITVFKTRRKEAEKRLESTNERLKNLGDIEIELSRQKESLTEQVQKASEKIKLTQEHKAIEIELIQNHVGFYRSMETKIKKEMESKQSEMLEANKDAAVWESEANYLKTEHLELTQQIKSFENKLDDHKIALTKYEERQENYKRRKDERSTQRDRLTQEIAEERVNLRKEEEKKATALAEVEKAETDLRRMDELIETQHAQLEASDEALQVERLKGEEVRLEMRAIESARNSVRVKNETLLESIAKYNQNVQKVQENERAYHVNRTQIAADKEELASQLRNTAQGLDEIVLKRSSLEHKLHQERSGLEDAQQTRDDLKQKYLEVNSFASSLEKLMESNAGLSDGALMLKEKLSKKISGFLFDHVSLHSEDEPLLEQAMPLLFQSAIVESVDEFIDVIDKAEELETSRIGMLVKDYIAPFSPQEAKVQKEILALPGVRCVGKRLEKLNWPSAQHIFERIFICQDEWVMWKAKKASKDFLHFVFLTERGTLCSGPHEISFGSFEGNNNSQGILNQKRKYAEALVLKEDYQAQLATQEGALFALNETRVQIETQLNAVLSQLEKEKGESIKLSSTLENFNLQLQHVDENIARMQDEKKRLEQEMDELRAQFAKNQTQIETLDTDFKKLERDLNDFEIDFFDKKSQRDELATKLQTHKSNHTIVSERQGMHRRSYEEICFQLTRMQQRLDNQSMQLEELKTQLNQSDSETMHLETEVASLQKQVAALESQLDFLVNKEDEVTEKLRILERQLQTQKDSTSSKQKFITEKQVELARIEAILETALKEAFDKHKITANELPTTALNNFENKNKLEAKAKEIEQKLANLGAVNERALEEFKEVNERLNFLVTQKQDIELSMQELLSSIRDIEETTKYRFKEIYDKVNIEFQKIFPVLFPGGHSELHLLQEENLLTTGVEILVRLPGKKTQNMSLFSGGEKALTAISLIFSLLKTTPAPFCFLDEVDAPLDEANVGRFNAVLDALSGEFQFVVITHNRRTMEVLDTIYGISMNEPGVSKLVSVDLSEVPEHLRKKQKVAIRAPGGTAAVEIN